MTNPKQSGRKRFPIWLRDQVEQGNIDGVYWLDNQKSTFRVPWTRVDSPEFDSAKDALLFQRWAEFTGRYRVGERTDPSVWKTRFRCAIRKMSEIEEITVASNLEDKGGSQPFRVFRFKKEVPILSNRKKSKKFRRCNIDQRPKNSRSRSLGCSKYQRKRSRVTGQNLVSGVTCSRTQSATQDWINRDIVTRGMQMTQMVPIASNVTNGVTFDELHQRVTANEITATAPQEKYWPIINGASIRSSSCEITFSDLSIQHVIGYTPSALNNNRDCVTMEQSQFGYNGLYHNDNDDLTSLLVSSEGTRGGNEQQCLPKISVQEVNSVLQSCSYPQYYTPNNQIPNSTNGTERGAQLPRMYPFIAEEIENSLSSEQFKLGLCDDCQESKACGTDLNDLTEILGLHNPSINDDVM